MGAQKRSWLILVGQREGLGLEDVLLTLRSRLDVNAADASTLRTRIEELQADLAKAHRRVATLEAQLAKSAHDCD